MTSGSIEKSQRYEMGYEKSISSQPLPIASTVCIIYFYKLFLKLVCYMTQQNDVSLLSTK